MVSPIETTDKEMLCGETERAVCLDLIVAVDVGYIETEDFKGA
jgi:hypothetical protein